MTSSMKQAIAFVCGVFFAATVSAACPAADALIERYGISFSGFEKPVPRFTGEPERIARPGELVRIDLPNKKGTVMDGFQHAAFINKATKRAWLLRTGGFAGVYEWYGPVAVENLEFSGCVVSEASPK